MAVDEKVLSFVDTLRDSGLAVSLAESMDAFEALKVVPLESVGLFREALRATLIKNEMDFPLFDALFDEFFCGSEAIMAQAAVLAEDEDEPPAFEELAEMLRIALEHGEAEQVAALARMAAAAVGRMEGGFAGGSRPMAIMAGKGYYVFKGMDMLEFSAMAAEVEEMASEGRLAGDVPPALAAEQVRERVEVFRRAFEREVRRRIAAERGSDAVRYRERLPSRPEDVDFINASLRQVEEMRRVLPGLSRKLAARIARRNASGRRGRVDVRSTLRHSISTGGVPMEVKYRKRVPAKPELWILCDVSGSVRTFSTFTLQLVYSLHQQFKAVRSFVFIDRIDEVTDCFKRLDVQDAVESVYTEADVVDGDGHSDVGRALEMFNKEYATEVGPRSTVLVLSDARNNARDPRAQSLERLSKRARKVYWLNPEARERWDTGDSIIGFYQGHCDAVVECRNLRQLTDFVYSRT